MSDPHATRPYMPGNGTVGPDEGRGLLPWSWAEERLIASIYTAEPGSPSEEALRLLASWAASQEADADAQTLSTERCHA